LRLIAVVRFSRGARAHFGALPSTVVLKVGCSVEIRRHARSPPRLGSATAQRGARPVCHPDPASRRSPSGSSAAPIGRPYCTAVSPTADPSPAARRGCNPARLNGHGPASRRYAAVGFCWAIDNRSVVLRPTGKHHQNAAGLLDEMLRARRDRVALRPRHQQQQGIVAALVAHQKPRGA